MRGHAARERELDSASAETERASERAGERKRGEGARRANRRHRFFSPSEEKRVHARTRQKRAGRTEEASQTDDSSKKLTFTSEPAMRIKKHLCSRTFPEKPARTCPYRVSGPQNGLQRLQRGSLGRAMDT